MNFLRATWSNLVMVNYAVQPELLQPYLPFGTELDYFEGKTYVSLVGFMFMRSRVFGLRIPWVGTFEEINLRFYVTRKDDGGIRRGVVFINETVPNGVVAWVARRLYNEQYTVKSVSHKWEMDDTNKHIEYYWYHKGELNRIAVTTKREMQEILPRSMEEYIFEHYYGYTRLSATRTAEFKIAHPRWHVNTVLEYEVNVDFAAMYGNALADLTGAKPASILLAEGSDVTVQWDRTAIQKLPSPVKTDL